MALVARYEGLTLQQRKFVAGLRKGLSPEASAEAAGYNQDIPEATYVLMHTPVIIAAIHTAIRHDILTEGVRIGNETLKRIAQDKKAPAGAQVDAAKALLDRAGISAKKAPDKPGGGDKPLSEYSVAELEQMLTERAKSARDVTPAAKTGEVLPPASDEADDLFS